MYAMLYTDFLHLVFPSWIVSEVYGDFFFHSKSAVFQEVSVQPRGMTFTNVLRFRDSPL